MKKNVLIIHDGSEICNQIEESLKDEETNVRIVNSYAAAVGTIKACRYTLIIAEVSDVAEKLSDFIEALRRITSAPFFLLSNKSTAKERARALKSGADDFLSLPCDFEECIERANALIRRYVELNNTNDCAHGIVGYHEMMLDTANRLVSIGGKDISLTRKEYEILLFILTNRSKVLTYEEIYSAVWHDTYLKDNATIFYHVGQLRKKIGEKWIFSVYGIGYRFGENVEK